MSDIKHKRRCLEAMAISSMIDECLNHASARCDEFKRADDPDIWDAYQSAVGALGDAAEQVMLAAMADMKVQS
jgi:hypothetical protein